MGVYAQTDFSIKCKNAKSAQAVIKRLRAMKEDENGNTFGKSLKREKEMVYGFEESGRIQNLDYRCDEIWEQIRKIKGVIEFCAPYMVEGEEGKCYTNEKDE